MESFIRYILTYRKYLIESGLLLVSFLVLAGSFALYILNTREPPHFSQNTSQFQQVKEKVPENSEEEIVVDITGAVMKPDSYHLASSARLKDGLTKAGGLSDLAAKDFFYRNYNLAEHLYDQEKIYVPSELEVSNGIFKEDYRLVTSDNPPLSPIPISESISKVHINTASIDELDGLPGVGATTAQKIIDNRPYSQLDMLLDKKVVSSNVFNKLKELIDL